MKTKKTKTKNQENVIIGKKITKIYLVTNCYGDPNKVYIGKTKNCRKNDHIKIFGKDIIYTFVDEISSLYSKDWKPLECFWIEYFKFLGFEVQNKNEGGGGSLFNDEKSILNKLKKSNSKKDIILQLYENKSITEISDIIKLDFSTIKSLLVRENKYVKYKNRKLPSIETKNKMKKIMINKLGKIINQYDKQNNFIKEWPSQAEIERILKIKQTDISACCNNRQKTAGGFIWKFKN